MIDVVWSENPISDDNRSWYATSTLLNLTLDRAEVGFVHRNGFKELPADSPGAVVIIHGEHQRAEWPVLREQVARLGWALIVIIGDEPGVFPSQHMRGNRRKIWIQFPVPGRHDYADHYLMCSYPPDCTAHLLAYKDSPRQYDWSFAGQVQNPNRARCVVQLKMLHCGYLYTSERFWHGLPRDEYYKIMAATKIVACPTGSCTPDTIRVAEALEFGCVPVAEDSWADHFRRPPGYWKYVLGEEPPFPTVTQWDQFPVILDRELKAWPDNANRLQVWWAEYKRRMCSWLIDDLRSVGAM